MTLRWKYSGLCTVSLLLYVMVLKNISPSCGVRAYLILFWILLRYNSLPCGTECFTGCREAQTTNAREKQACSWFGLIGCRDVITSCVSASFSLVAAILDALLSLQSCFLLYLWIYCLSFVHNSAFPLFSSIES